MERPGTEGRGARSRNHGPQDQRGGLGLGPPKATRGGLAGSGRRSLGTGSEGVLYEGKGLPRPGAPKCVPAAWRRQRVKGGKRKHLRPIRHLLRGKVRRLRRGRGARSDSPARPSSLPPARPQPSPSHLVTRPATPRRQHTSTPGHRGSASRGGGEEGRTWEEGGSGGEGRRADPGGGRRGLRGSWLEETRWFD